MCILIPSKAFVQKYFILRRTEGDMIIMYIGAHVKYRLFLSDISETSRFFAVHCPEILEYQISRKSVQWQPSCSVQPDGQTLRS